MIRDAVREVRRHRDETWPVPYCQPETDCGPESRSVDQVVEGPAYKRLADELRNQIRGGHLPAGTRLPSLPQLGQQHSVGADVARQAVGILRDEGLVETRHGAGTFIRAVPVTTRAQWGSGKAIQDDHDTESRWRTMDVVVTEVPAPSDVADALNLETGAPVVARTWRSLAGDRPVRRVTSYYPVEIARGTALTYTSTGPGGAYARLAEMGHEPVRFRDRIEDRAPDPTEQTDLALPVSGSRVLDVTRLAFSTDDRCVEVKRIVMDAAVYVLEYDFNA